MSNQTGMIINDITGVFIGVTCKTNGVRLVNVDAIESVWSIDPSNPNSDAMIEMRYRDGPIRVLESRDKIIEFLGG